MLLFCRAPDIYEQQVRPVLEAAGCQPEMHLTQARAHATGQPADCIRPCVALFSMRWLLPALPACQLPFPTPMTSRREAPSLACPALLCPAELLRQVAPDSVDAVVAIGGDGTMHEVLQVGRLAPCTAAASRHCCTLHDN